MEHFHLHQTMGESVKLTQRETEILTLILEGLFSQEVADRLCVQKCTVDFHLMNIYEKLGVSNRLHAIHRASQLGLIAPPDYVAMPAAPTSAQGL
jgi:ATP/maltotriose-dependent transcriptional regulator MalT